MKRPPEFQLVLDLMVIFGSALVGIGLAIVFAALGFVWWVAIGVGLASAIGLVCLRF